MTIEDITNHFGSLAEIDKLFGRRVSSNWGRKSRDGVPVLWQYRLALISRGALRVSDPIWEEGRPTT